MYETKFVASMTCINTMQTWFDFEQDITTLRLTSGMTVWDHVCVLVVDALSTCSSVNVHLYDSSENFMKLSMSFDALNVYFVV